MNRVLLPRAICAPPVAASGDAYTLQGRVMGVAWSVQLCGELPPQAWLQRDVQQTLDRLDAQMSHWAPDSDLAIYNRRPAGTWQPVPPALFELLEAALQIARDSDGACDPTLGALVKLWGFGPGQARDTPPDAAQVAQHLARCGWTRLALDPRGQRVFQPGGLELDLSCIAKGYAVDAVCARLDELGLAHFLVELGGELRGAGWKADGSPWWVEIERPEGATARTLVALHGLAVASSGDYRQCFEHQGRRYAHTLDPRSGWPPVEAPAGVTVLHPSAMQADAQATVLSVLATEAALDYADRHDLAAILLLREDGGRFSERLSRAATAMLE